jgi:hypothetical protein
MAGEGDVGQALASVDARGAEAAADWANVRSRENYVGYERTENFASLGGAVLDKRRVYAAPGWLRLNHWALSGDWTMEKQAAVLNEADGRIAYGFHARDLRRRPRQRDGFRPAAVSADPTAAAHR